MTPLSVINSSSVIECYHTKLSKSECVVIDITVIDTEPYSKHYGQVEIKDNSIIDLDPVKFIPTQVTKKVRIKGILVTSERLQGYLTLTEPVRIKGKLVYKDRLTGYLDYTIRLKGKLIKVEKVKTQMDKKRGLD